jgi:hypothetical protein
MPSLTNSLAGLLLVPGIDPHIVLSAGATNLNFGPAAEKVYNHAPTQTHYVPVAMAALFNLRLFGHGIAQRKGEEGESGRKG